MTTKFYLYDKVIYTRDDDSTYWFFIDQIQIDSFGTFYAGFNADGRVGYHNEKYLEIYE